jgi:hypothetical protein
MTAHKIPYPNCITSVVGEYQLCNILVADARFVCLKVKQCLDTMSVVRRGIENTETDLHDEDLAGNVSAPIGADAARRTPYRIMFMNVPISIGPKLVSAAA